MLLNYKKPVLTSSTLGAGHPANDAVDEDIKTYWSAATGNKGEWIQSDLGATSTINAIQINYADQDAEFLGKQQGIFHQYKLYSSIDGKKWQLVKDKSDNHTDVPHDYIELKDPVQARFIKLENIHMPTGKFAISGLRVFGKGGGAIPDAVKDLIVLAPGKTNAAPGLNGARLTTHMPIISIRVWRRINCIIALWFRMPTNIITRQWIKKKPIISPSKPSMRMVYHNERR